jgi:hypothetical protein
MSFKDIIQQGAAKQTQLKKTPKADNTKDILASLSAKATGKAQADQPTGQINVEEIMGGVQADQQLDQIQTQFQQRAADLGMQEQQAKAQREENRRQRTLVADQINTQFSDSVNNLLSVIGESDAELEDRKDAHQLEILGMQLALQDRKYTDKIVDIGRRQRLDDATAFQEEAFRIIIGNKTSALLDNLAEIRVEGAKARDFNEANLIDDLESANALLEAQIADDLAASQIGAAAQAGSSIYSAYSNQPEKPETETSGLGSIWR